MASFNQVLSVVDTHTAGEPTRIVLSGYPPLRGETVVEKSAYARERLDHLRTALMLEPRGHRDMFGAILTTPGNPDADWGLIFMDGGVTCPCAATGRLEQLPQQWSSGSWRWSSPRR